MPTRDSLSTVVCTGCSCLCDDIQLERLSKDSVKASNACDQGREHLDAILDNIRPGTAYIEGKEVELKTAAAQIADLLRQSRYPLVAGLEHLGIQGQQVATEIALSCSAVIDSSIGTDGRNTIFSLQREGTVTATLGEIAKSELVVFWFCNPDQSHPRFRERFTQNDNCLNIDLDPRYANASAQVCELLLSGQVLSNERVLALTSQSIDDWNQFLARCLSASKVSLIFQAQATTPEFDPSIDSLMSFVKQMNTSIRVVTIHLSGPNNKTGAENVIAWSTGFPFAVSSGAQKRYHYLEYSAATTLERKECDAALLFLNANNTHDISGEMLAHLSKIPTVVCGSPPDMFDPQFLFICELRETGDWVRMDDVYLPVDLGCRGTGESTIEFLQTVLNDLRFQKT